MTERENFIKVVEFAFGLMREFFDTGEKPEDYNFSLKDLDEADKFFQNFKEEKLKNSSGKMTENGLKVLSWMQENVENMTNVFTSKEIAEALFTSGRSVAGSMRKLVNDGFVEKIGKDPVQYALTEQGKNYS